MSSGSSIATPPYAVGRFLAEFKDPALERAYLFDRYPADKRLALVGAVLLVVTWVGSIGLDFFMMLPDHAEVARRLLAVRFIGIGICVLGARIVVRSLKPKTLARCYLGAIAVVGSCYAYIVVQYSNTLEVSQNGAVYIVSAILIVCFAPIPLRYSLSGVIALALSAVALNAYVLDTPFPMAFLFAFSISICIALAAAFSNLLQQTRRREYGGIEQLRAANARLESEIESRKRAEDELRDHQENLEALVRERTQELHNSELQLRTAQKMESVGQLAGGIAHDFSNLLVVILGCTEMALKDPSDAKRIQPLLEEIRDAASRASTLTRQLLAFSSRQIMEPEPVDVKELVDGLENMLARLVPANIRLSFSTSGGPHVVMADPGQLEQAIVNLVLNARDALPNGGDIRVSLAEVEVDESFLEANAAAKTGPHTVVEVSDSGMGIKPHIRERMFEPFFTTKAAGMGTGLGLSVVFGIVNQLNGFLDVYSEPGVGSEFRMYLPSTQKTRAKKTVAEPTKTLDGNETILIAEDDSRVRKLAQRVLREAGYTISVAPDGEAAVMLFQHQKQDVDAVILDVVMPNMGGEKAYEAIRKLDPEVPILFCSGYSEGGIHTDFLLKEGLVLLRKPYRPDDLLRAVRGILDK